MTNRKLSLESLEDRTLLAVTAGGMIELAVDLGVQDWTNQVSAPENESPVAVSADSISKISATSGSQSKVYDTAYERIDEKINTIHAYFNDPAYTRTETNNYALYFAGGGDDYNNDYSFYSNVVNFYCTLTTEFNIVPDHIWILYADGTDPGVDRQDGQNSDMTFATNYGTEVYSATRANLTAVMDVISAKMDADSHLFIYGEDHGSGEEGDPYDYYDYICGWGGFSEYLSGADVAEQVFKVQEG